MELGAAFLCAHFGFCNEGREDHAGYIEYWLRMAKADKKALFKAAASAQKAVGFLYGLQPENQTINDNAASAA